MTVAPPVTPRWRHMALRLLLAGLAVLLLASLARAQVAILRSGDHADFTRLTLPLPEGSSFTLDRGPGQATLTLSGPLQSVDSSQVFNRIGRDRLTGVTIAEGPQVTLDLACNCPIESTVTARNLLILDIRDGPALTAPAPEDPATAPPLIAGLPAPTPPEPAAPVSVPARPEAVPPEPARRESTQASLSFGLTSRDPMAPGPVSLAGAALAPPRQASARVPDAAQPPTGPLLPPVTLPQTSRDAVADRVSTLTSPPALTEEEARLTRELEESLLAAIGAAATEGLLSPDARAAASLTDSQRQVTQTPSDGVHPDPGLAATPSTFGNDDPRGRERVILSGNPCALRMQPLVAGAEPDFPAELARLRAALTGEFDRDDVGAYHDLAQLYLAYGFGAEALSVLDAVQQPPLEAAEMASVARIQEYGHDPQTGPFAGRLTCDTDAAFWAALTPVQLPPGPAYDGDAIKRTLMALPDPLKAAMGPLLAGRFMAAGEADFAREILRIIERNLVQTSPRQALAAAMLANEAGPPDKADFQALIAGNSDVSPDALLHYTNETLAHGGQVDAETIGLLESYRSQYREGDLAIELTRAEILARAAAQDFPGAFALYDAEGARFSDPTRDELMEAMARDLADHGSAAIFTRLYFTHAEELAARVRPATLNRLAGRLLDLGLPEVAETLLRPEAEGEAETARRLLRARTALAMNLPRSAEAQLEALEGIEADRLRAEARLAREDFAAASSLFTAAGDAAAAEQASWLARDWQQLQDSEAERARLAEVLQQPPVPLPDLGPPTLAASREVLTQSDVTRTALRDLLSTLQVAPLENP